VSFTTVCPSCGGLLRLLDRYRGCKVMCPSCRKPFLALRAADEALEADVPNGELPSRGWLLVCPVCGQTEVVPEVGPPRDLCSGCGASLLPPRTPSKPIRKKKD
jgi:hypothetical protein